MEEKADRARVVFGCAGCAARADSAAELKHEEKPHAQKLVKTCTKSGTVPHAVPPAKYKQGVMKEGRFVQPWYGFRIKKIDGFLLPDARRPPDVLMVMCDKFAKDSLSVLVDDKHAHRTLEDIHSAAAAQIKAMNAKILKDEEVDFAGTKAFVIAYEWATTQGAAKLSMYYVRHGENFLVVQVQDVAPVGDHDKQFKTLLDSFELLK